MATSRSDEDSSARTIADFGEQWTRFDNKTGYLGSLDQLREQLRPFLAPSDIVGLRVADVGAGTGRVAAQLVEAGALGVAALEPSDAFGRLVLLAAKHPGRITPMRLSADQIPEQTFDLVVCFGVLHHIPDPVRSLQGFRRALRPGGRALVWVYGREGNGAYLALARPLRALTRRLPTRLLDLAVWTLYPGLRLYMSLAGRLPLPMHGYVRGVLSKLPPEYVRLTIYDQLNPHYARYYREAEIRAEFEAAGFTNIETAHKNGYSWLVSGLRPDQGAEAR